MIKCVYTYSAYNIQPPTYTANYHQASPAPSACGQAYTKGCSTSIWSPGCSKPCIFGIVRAKCTLGNAGDFSSTATKIAAAPVQKEHPAAPAVVDVKVLRTMQAACALSVLMQKGAQSLRRAAM